MQLPLCALFVWVTIIIFTLVPKKLSVLDFVFIYCVTFILSTLSYTTYDVNLHIVTIPRNPTTSFAVIMCRIVSTPLLILMAVNALQRGANKPSWVMAIGAWITLTVFDGWLNSAGVIDYHNWNVWYAAVAYLVFIGASYGVLWLFQRWCQHG